MKKTFQSISSVLLAVYVFQGCGAINDSLNKMASEGSQSFTTMVEAAETAEDAKAAIEYYKRLELDFLKFKAKNNFDEPFSNYRKSCAPALAKLKSNFNITPEYNSTEKFLFKVVE